jgi:hypothetical protein
MADEKLRTLKVKATDPQFCGVWDKSPDQLGGEVFVSGEDVVEVAATPIVLDALAKGRIVEVSGHTPTPQPSEGPHASATAPGRK